MDLKNYLDVLPRGGPTSFAKELGISPSHLSQMAAGTTPISPSRCVQIERATGGTVTRRDLRPDDWQQIWPELHEAIQQPGFHLPGIRKGK